MAGGSSKLLIDEQPLQVLPSLAKAIGLEEAIFLQQLHFWLTYYNSDPEHEYDGRIWIFNKYDEWHEQLPFLSVRKLERVVNALKKRKLLFVCRRGYDPRNWYSIDYDAVERMARTCALSPRKSKKATRQNGGQVSAKMAVGQSAELADALPAKMADADHKSPETTIEIAASRPSAGAFNEDLMAFHQQHIAGSIPNGKAQGKAIKELYEDGFCLEDCKAVYRSLLADKFWRDKVSWLTVRQQIGTRLPALRAVCDQSHAVAEEFGANRQARSFSTPEEFAAATGKPIEEVRANWS